MRRWVPAAGGAALAELLPTLTAIRAVRTQLTPGLCGVGSADHVALTIDDGPDPEATPAVLDTLRDLGVRATFFVLGEAMLRQPALGRRLVEAGHDVGLHGYWHRPHALRSPVGVAVDLRRAHRAVTAVAGAAPAFWRPPNGIPTTSGLEISRRLGMHPVLWTADGRDWRPEATPESLLERIAAHLRGGGVVLLHDGRESARGGRWRTTVDALPRLVELCARRGWRLGPLTEHDLDARMSRRSRCS